MKVAATESHLASVSLVCNSRLPTIVVLESSDAVTRLAQARSSFLGDINLGNLFCLSRAKVFESNSSW